MFSARSRFMLSCLVTSIVMGMSACQDRLLETYEINEPVYMSYEALRESVDVTGPAELRQPGKIYLYGDYVFVNELKEGIHVIDNADPAQPRILSFIGIPGNADMAIRDGILYADSYVDLVALDIKDLDQVREVARFEDVFAWDLPPYEPGSRVAEVDQDRGVVVAWNTREVTEELEQGIQPGFPVRAWEERAFDGINTVRFASAGTGGTGQTGTGGSMARFIIHEDLLYTIDRSNLHMFNISQPLSPVSTGSTNIGWNIETVFIDQGHLFIGAMTGMYIYSLKDPANPAYVSTYWHVTSCDPVVVEGHYAYVTLRTGNICETDVNRLDVVDIHHIESPVKLKTYPMHNPHGLGIEENMLYVCDGDEGLKVYDASDPLRLKDNLIAHFDNINAFDVIPVNQHLLMIGLDGLYQYAYLNHEQLQLISMIPIYQDQ